MFSSVVKETNLNGILFNVATKIRDNKNNLKYSKFGGYFIIIFYQSYICQTSIKHFSTIIRYNRPLALSYSFRKSSTAVSNIC